MRVVLDTNVVVSGLLTVHGVCAQVIDRMEAGDFGLCVDGRILAEYGEVLARPELVIPPGLQRDFLDFVRCCSERVNPAPLALRLPHKDDRPFIEVAAAAEAVLVTGNKRHYPKRARGSVTVVDCGVFLDLLREAARE